MHSARDFAACLFCAIARRETAAHVVYEDADSLAFLDRAPLFFGHALVVPRAHVVTLDALAEDALAPLFSAVQRVMRAVTVATGAEGSFVAMNNRVSQSVAHLHVHVVPRTKGDGLKGFFWPRRKYPSDEAMAEWAAKIRGALA